jgi:hypothetical protein
MSETSLRLNFNRFTIACGRAAQTGDASELHKLLGQIRLGQKPPPTASETGMLQDYILGKFRRKRGEHKSQARQLAGQEQRELVKWMKQIKLELKKDPKEKELKRQGHYNIDDRTAEVAQDRLKGSEMAGEYSHRTLLNALRRPLKSTKKSKH